MTEQLQTMLSSRERTMMLALTGGPASTTDVARHVWPTSGRRKRGFAGMDLRALTNRHLVERKPDGRWALTPAGIGALVADELARQQRP